MAAGFMPTGGVAVNTGVGTVQGQALLWNATTELWEKAPNVILSASGGVTITDVAGPQWRAAYSGSVYAEFEVDASGNAFLTNSGSAVSFPSVANIVGATGRIYQIGGSYLAIIGGDVSGGGASLWLYHKNRAGSTRGVFQLSGAVSGIDAEPGDSTIIGAGAISNAVTNLVGGGIDILGGPGASASVGNAHGGPVRIDGGRSFGTGVDGDVLISTIYASGVVQIGSRVTIANQTTITNAAGPQVIFKYDGAAEVSCEAKADGFLHFGAELRNTNADYRRYYHLPLSSFNPGASGATWITANVNTTGGWRLDAVGEVLEFGSDVHSDWDGASDMTVEAAFAVNIDNSGGDVGDTVDLKLQAFYSGTGDTATKTQTVEVATVVGQSAQYKVFNVEFTIDWDYASNVVEAGDKIGFILNLETDTSEVDDIIMLEGGAAYFYNTTHVGVESGDV